MVLWGNKLFRKDTAGTQKLPRNLGIQGKKEHNASRLLKDERGISMIYYLEALLLCEYCMVWVSTAFRRLQPSKIPSLPLIVQIRWGIKEKPQVGRNLWHLYIRKFWRTHNVQHRTNMLKSAPLGNNTITDCFPKWQEEYCNFSVTTFA